MNQELEYIFRMIAITVPIVSLIPSIELLNDLNKDKNIIPKAQQYTNMMLRFIVLSSIFGNLFFAIFSSLLLLGIIGKEQNFANFLLFHSRNVVVVVVLAVIVWSFWLIRRHIKGR